VKPGRDVLIRSSTSKPADITRHRELPLLSVAKPAIGWRKFGLQFIGYPFLAKPVFQP